MSQRYQKEIEDILKQAGELAPAGRGPGQRPSIWRLIWLYLQRSLGGRKRAVSSGRVMLAGAGLLVLALIFSRTVPGIGGLLAVAGLVLFIVAYALAFAKPQKTEKRWRGRVVDADDSWWSRFRRRPR